MGLILVVLATACWSTSGIFISWIINGSGASAVELAFWRDLGTFFTVLVGVLLLRPSLLRIKLRDLPWLAVMGAMSIGFFHVLWNLTVMMNGAAVATVIQCNAPIFVTFMAWIIWGEPLTYRKIIAILLSIVGTVLIARIDQLGQMQFTLVGVLVGLVTAIFYGTLSLFGKKLTGSYNSWTILLYIFGFATLTLWPFQLRYGVPWPLPSRVLLNFAGLILLPTTLGFGLYTLGLHRLQASVAAITATTEVPFASILAFFLLGERLDGWQILGAVLIICGVILVSLSRSTQPAAQPRLAFLIPRRTK